MQYNYQPSISRFIFDGALTERSMHSARMRWQEMLKPVWLHVVCASNYTPQSKHTTKIFHDFDSYFSNDMWWPVWSHFSSRSFRTDTVLHALRAHLTHFNISANRPWHSTLSPLLLLLQPLLTSVVRQNLKINC